MLELCCNIKINVSYIFNGLNYQSQNTWPSDKFCKCTVPWWTCHPAEEHFQKVHSWALQCLPLHPCCFWIPPPLQRAAQLGTKREIGCCSIQCMLFCIEIDLPPQLWQASLPDWKKKRNGIDIRKHYDTEVSSYARCITSTSKQNVLSFPLFSLHWTLEWPRLAISKNPMDENVYLNLSGRWFDGPSI